MLLGSFKHKGLKLGPKSFPDFVNHLSARSAACSPAGKSPVRNSRFPIGTGCGKDEEEGRKPEGRGVCVGGREFQREMVPRHGEYLVSTGDFRVCT